jgi:predicted esterase
VEGAVQEFFRLDLAGAAKSLDNAWLAMLPSPSASKRNSAAVSLSIASALVEASQPKIAMTLQAIYPQPDPNWPDSATVEIELSPAHLKDSAKRQSKTWPVESLPIQIEWELEGMEPGDYQLSGTIQQDGMRNSIIGTQISVIKDKRARLQAISNWVEENKRATKTSSLCTARMFGKQLLLADRGKNFECDLPLSSWFREFESIASSTPTFRPTGPNGRWQVLTDGRVEQVVRIQMPIKQTEKHTLVFAFHGAGGSENMFFETYGAGRLIELAKARDWVVVCPRQGLTGLSIQVASMIPMLESELGLSFDRVFFVGHSMGAAQAIEQVSKSQERISAVAAIGGGGSPQKADPLVKIPFFVSAGERDFGRSNARRLRDTLNSFGCKVDYSEYKDVEHLTIVQACLDELFQFFDRQ